MIRPIFSTGVESLGVVFDFDVIELLCAVFLTQQIDYRHFLGKIERFTHGSNGI